MKIFLESMICTILLLSFVLAGCSSQNDEKTSALLSTENVQLIYEESVSPNEASVAAQENVVNYVIRVYQNKEKDIIINADSNSAFFKTLQYVLNRDKEIPETDIDIKWTTLMGDTEATEENQLGIAHVTISADGEVFSQRNINFVKKGMEIVIDIVNQ